MVSKPVEPRWRICLLAMLVCAVAWTITACGSSQSHAATSHQQASASTRGPTAHTRSLVAAPRTSGTNSTPGSFMLPQLGVASFRCGTGNRGVQPFFDMHGTTSEEKVTIKSGTTIRQNFSVKTIGHIKGHALTEVHYAPGVQIALPFGRYHVVAFKIHQGTEARMLDASLVAQFVVAKSVGGGVPGSRYACYVKHWSAEERVTPS
jgi:hypothetical protein